jgi:amino acid permease
LQTSHDKPLTILEAASIVAGLGVGGGIMAVPYLASLNGLLPIVGVLSAAFLLSVLLHLFVAEIVMRDGSNEQLVELFGRYLFRGRGGPFFTWVFFILVVFNFYTLLAGYIVGAGEILQSLTGIPLMAGEILIYLLAASVIFFGLKALGLGEKYAVIGIALLLLVLSAASMARKGHGVALLSPGIKEPLALYGMIMFSLACFFSIPQAARGLAWNRRRIPAAVILGISINLLFVTTITFMTLRVSSSVTEVAIIGWGQALGSWARTTGGVFVLLAILTSYWSISYALAVIMEERLKWTYPAAWTAATLPTLLLAVSGLTGFLGFMRLAGGAIAILIAVLVVPTLRSSRKNATDPAPFDMGIWGGKIAQWTIIGAYLLAAAGSMVSIR